MTTARELAARHGMQTADTIPPPKTGAAAWGSGLDQLKLTPEQLKIFKKVKPVALNLVGTDGPISVTLWDRATGQVTKRLGHNRGVWPMRWNKSGSHTDTATQTYNKSPFVFVGTQLRMWFEADAFARHLLPEVTELLLHLSEQAMGTELINEYVDVGPDFLLPEFEGEMISRAEKHRCIVRTDDELVSWLERIRRDDHLLAELGGR